MAETKKYKNGEQLTFFKKAIKVNETTTWVFEKIIKLINLYNDRQVKQETQTARIRKETGFHSDPVNTKG